MIRVLFVVILAGCSVVRDPVPEVIAVTPPAGLLVCPPDPLAPDPVAMTQDDVAYLYLEQYNVTQVCRRSIESVKEWGGGNSQQ